MLKSFKRLKIEIRDRKRTKEICLVFQIPSACAREAPRNVEIPQGFDISFESVLWSCGGESVFTGGIHYLLVKSNSPESFFTSK